MKHMALDYGEKRTGIAVSDSGGTTAFPYATIIMRGKDVFFAELLKLAEEERVEVFVLGLPLRENGEESEMTRRARNTAARLKRRSCLPVYLMPENLSSHEAEQRLREAGCKDGKLKEKLDQMAAAVILESFLRLPEEKRLLA